MTLDLEGQVNDLLENGKSMTAAAKQKENLDELIALYDSTTGDETSAAEIRAAVLTLLARSPELLREERFALFVAQHVEAEDFAALQWQKPHDALALFEVLSSHAFEDKTTAEMSRQHAQNLLRQAMQQFEKQGDLEYMFRLLHFAPLAGVARDDELLRLRNRAHLYEMNRVQRNRRVLYGWLLLQVVLVFLVFPLLFINAENGRIQHEIEQMTEVDVSEPGERAQFLSYNDGLYWSLITAGSIGYGDVTPNTLVGRIIAASLGVMGVITVGVIAGLILDRITPRR